MRFYYYFTEQKFGLEGGILDVKYSNSLSFYPYPSPVTWVQTTSADDVRVWPAYAGVESYTVDFP